MSRPEIFGLGQCCLDHIGLIADYPPPDVKCEMTNLEIHGGGPVATALVALARWGKNCYFAGVIGDDPFGREILASLGNEGVDTTGVVVRSGCSSQMAFIVAEPAWARRTIFWQRPTGEPLRPEEIDLAILEQARIFHTDGLFLEAAIFAGKKAKEKGIPVVVDGGTLRPGMLDLARVSDYFIASGHFARQLTGDDDALAACRILVALGPRLGAVTRGRQGYVAYYDGRVIERPAYLVDTVDTTGCGDVFHAGFIYGLSEGWSMEASLDLGAWAAAEVSRRVGGRRGIPTLAEVNAHAHKWGRF